MDTQVLPKIHVATANVTDRAGALEAFNLKLAEMSEVNSFLEIAAIQAKILPTQSTCCWLDAWVEAAKRNELHKFSVIPQRWLVERSFALLEKCQRIWKNCEQNIQSSLAIVQIVFIALIVKRH